jgi:hypothetical protein
MLVVRDTTRVDLAANDTNALRAPRNRGSWPPSLPPRARQGGITLPQAMTGGLAVRTDGLSRRDRSAIIVDEWGPYDWRSPQLWPVDSSRVTPLRLRVLGPAGQWRIVDRRGVARVSRASGSTNDTIVVTPTAVSEGDWEITLEYRGAATVSPRGERRAAGVPYRFGYRRFEPRMSWKIDFFTWPDSADPRSNAESFATILRASPILTRQEPRLDYMWYRPPIPGLPQSRFAVVAATTVTLEPGEYTLRTISDDGIRVWLDGRLIIDNWKPHDSTVDLAAIGPGRHELRVEYFQVDGWTELRVEVVPGIVRSTGSPGPH